MGFQELGSGPSVPPEERKGCSPFGFLHKRPSQTPTSTGQPSTEQTVQQAMETARRMRGGRNPRSVNQINEDFQREFGPQNPIDRATSQASEELSYDRPGKPNVRRGSIKDKHSYKDENGHNITVYLLKDGGQIAYDETQNAHAYIPPIEPE